MNDPETAVAAVVDSLAGAAGGVGRLASWAALVLGLFGWHYGTAGWWVAAAFFAGAASIAFGLYVMCRMALEQAQ